MPQILELPRRWGALPEEWEAVRKSPLAPWLVPIVSNPSLPSSQNSQIPRGKVPSVKTPTGQVKGLTGWTAMIPPSPARLDAWAADPDYGFGVRLGNDGLFALDCDCDDPELSGEILGALAEALDVLWNAIAIRRRGNARWACILKLNDPAAEDFLAAKQIHPLEGGAALEVLVKGQQLAIAGTHPSGARYTWENGEVGDVDTISLPGILGFLAAVDTRFGAADALTLPAAKPRPNGENFSAKDRLADWLRPRALKEGRNGEIYFECPWIGGHTAKTNVQDTVYFPVGSRGGAAGGFKCLHAHCAGRTVKDLREWARSQGFTETDAEDFPDESAKDDGADEGEAVPELPELERFLDAKSGKFQACIEALEIALSTPAFCGLEFAFDAFSSGPVLRQKDAKWMPYQDETATKMRLALESKGFKRIARQDIIDLIHYIAQKQKIDLMRDFLDENIPQWDGVNRIDTFFKTYCSTKDTEWERAVARYMFSALWARAYCAGGEKGIKADIVPVLVGQQGAGKSTLARLLALDEDKCGNIDFELDNADLARAMREKIIMEIPELGGMTKREQNAVKAFISDKTDAWIPKYRETERRAARRCIFIMTTNDREFLSDPTGNRRWAPVEVGSIAFNAVENDRLQLWAEGRALFESGGVLFQDVDRLNAGVTENYTAADAWETLISDWLERERGEDFLTNKQLVELALQMDYAKIKKADQMRIAAIMRKLGFEKQRRMVGGSQMSGWGLA